MYTWSTYWDERGLLHAFPTLCKVHVVQMQKATLRRNNVEFVCNSFPHDSLERAACCRSLDQSVYSVSDWRLRDDLGSVCSNDTLVYQTVSPARGNSKMKHSVRTGEINIENKEKNREGTGKQKIHEDGTRQTEKILYHVCFTNSVEKYELCKSGFYDLN